MFEFVKTIVKLIEQIYGKKLLKKCIPQTNFCASSVVYWQGENWNLHIGKSDVRQFPIAYHGTRWTGLIVVCRNTTDG